MTPADLPADEAARLAFLTGLDVLDTPADPVLDGLVRCASQLLGYPIALVSLVDERRQWFKARTGLPAEQTPREMAFCAHAILGHGLFEVPDAQADPRFADNPLVTGAPHLRAYAGVPISAGGFRLGTLCVIDQVPRQLSPAQAGLLDDLAQAVSAWFVARREHLDLRAERERAQARLSLLEKLAEQAPGMLFQYRVGRDGRTGFPYVSPQVRELFALEPESLRDDLRPFLDRAHPDDRAALRATLLAAGQNGMAWRHEFRVLLPGQPLQWRAARAAPLPQPDGSLLWHGFVSDITEQAEVEQLRRDKHAAELASREKSAFLSRVSHELRTPLNAILGFTQLLQVDSEDALSPRQRERVDHAWRAARLLLELINDVLEVGRIEQGARELEPGLLSLQDLVTGVLPMVAQMAEQAEVHVGYMPLADGAQATVRADRRALEQVVLNLLTNGIKYNRRGGLLRVVLRRCGDRVCLDVCDQGAGLDAGQQARLFQPFDRLGAERTPVQGSGLGLVISRQLVETMGGRIAVDSVPGRGSTFSVELPCQGALPAGDPTRSDEAAAPTRPDQDVTVLYIEDDPVNALLVQEALRVRPQWRIVHAADGRSGLALAQRLRPTVVLTDINLPGLSGQGVVQALRHDPDIGSTLCIALSADAMAEQIEAAMHAGFDDYWTKPLDVVHLAQNIESWLDRGDSRRARQDTAL